MFLFVCVCVLACVLRCTFLLHFRHNNFACIFWVLNGKKILKVCPSLVRIFFQNGLQIFRLCAQYIIIVTVVSRYLEGTQTNPICIPIISLAQHIVED